MMTKPRIIVTRRWPEKVENELKSFTDAALNETDEVFGPERLKAALKEADAVLCTVTDAMTADILAEATQAKLLGNFGVGVNHIDLKAADEAGLTVTNTPGVLTDATADIAMTLLLMAARRAGEGERMVRAHAWSGWGPTQLLGTAVSGKTLGIIGMGRIGRAMAHRCHFGFGMDIVFYNRSPVSNSGIPGARQLATVEDVLQASDFVSLHCPGGGANRHLINADRLQAMKPTAFLINTARGDVVDEAALASALKAGAIGGAGLDVFEQEPAVHPDLLGLENAVLLPHLGSATRETRVAMGELVIKNLKAFLNGETPPNQVRAS
ncbi:MAG: D-glycerate dehydrogenase [Hyphomicrobiales bacterium]|nr:D-glycerate dehydrogenase [Hyphomicrobiales bacterium]